MALRAGYKGVKNDMIAAIKSLASLGIKSLGTMFNLSNKGVLTVKKATGAAAGIVQPDGVTITVENGVISGVGGGFDYSESEFDTGQKWIDGKTIYGKVLTGDTIPALGTVLLTGVDFVVNAYGAQLFGSEASERWYNYPYGNDLRWELYTSDHSVKVQCISSSFGTSYKWIFFYTKYEEE